MGLDMYILKTSKQDWEDYQTKKIDSIYPETETVAYWRKANAIHNWFVYNVQKGVDDCGFYKVNMDDLVTLIGVVNLALGKYFNSNNKGFEEASKILPPVSGFFFGSTENINFYRDDLINTLDSLSVIVNTWADDFVYLYHSSW